MCTKILRCQVITNPKVRIIKHFIASLNNSFALKNKGPKTFIKKIFKKIGHQFISKLNI